MPSLYFVLISSVKEMAKPNEQLSPVNGYLTFAPGVTQKRVLIHTVDDNTPEDNTPYTVVLYSPKGGARLDTASAEFKVRLEGTYKNCPGILHVVYHNLPRP